MVLTSLFILVLANFLCLFASYFLPHYANLIQSLLLLLNGVLGAVLLGVHCWRKWVKPRSKTSGSVALKENGLIEAVNQLDGAALLASLPDFLCVKDGQGRWLKASREYLASFNLQDTDYVGKTDEELITALPESALRALKLSIIQDKSAWHLGKPTKKTNKVAFNGNKNGVLEITRIPAYDISRKPANLILLGRFADEEDKIKLEQLAHALLVCHISVLFLDTNFNIIRANKRFTEQTGYQFEDLENKPLSTLLDGHFEPSSKDFFNNGKSLYWTGEQLCRQKEGMLMPIKLDITEIEKKGHNTIYFVTLEDISDKKQFERRIKQIAHHDDLTGLANRAVFFEKLDYFLAESRRRNLHTIIFHINLDRFKIVNDTFGQETGNKVMKEVALRLRQVTSKRDVVARLGGDEFALAILNEKTYEQAMYSALMIAGEVLRKIGEKMIVDRQEAFITASMGIAIYPEDGAIAERLLKHADIAMHEAKRLGRNNYQFYRKEGESEEHNREERHLLELGLRKALEKEELQLYYQPQYYTENEAIFGAEVLVRWLRGTGKDSQMNLPSQFIAIAEESGLIVEIGSWIVRTACQHFKGWQDKGHNLRQISINVSERQFLDDQFIQSIENALRESELDAKHLELEITETILFEGNKRIELQLQRLKKMGVRIALDDFGTGYSSLAYLKDLPIDTLKIDQSFVSRMGINDKDAKIAATMIEMGHALNQTIVAEGLETEEQFLYLKQCGCDVVQGHYFSPPLPVYKMTELLAAKVEGGEGEERNPFESKF